VDKEYNRRSIMALSLNPTEILKLFSDSRKNHKEQLAVWLDSVAADAREVADSWKVLRDKILEGDPSIALDRRALKRNMRMNCNFRPMSRLSGYYNTASRVVGGKIPPQVHEELSRTLANMILKRRLALSLYEDILLQPQVLDAIQIAEESEVEVDMSDFDEVVQILCLQAGALEVLAKNFRASI
jgi:hypothetical protein